MAITRIRASNFKSFESLDVDLQNFNVLVGANASGKSTFIRLFRFIRDVSRSGLDDAIAMQGGPTYFRNAKLGLDTEFKLEVESASRLTLDTERSHGQGTIGVKSVKQHYLLRLGFCRGRRGYRLLEERLDEDVSYVRLRPGRGSHYREGATLGTGIIVATNSGTELKYEVTIPEGLELEERDILPVVPESFVRLPHGRTLIESSALIPLLPPWERYLFEIRTFDFDPAVLKSTTPIYAVGQLTENGSNLAVVLRSILNRSETKAKWLALMHAALPFIDRFEVKVSTDRRLQIGVKEKYGPKFDFPAFLVSDGTLNVAALVTALYFQNEKHPLTLLEEPERNIHPSLISTLVEMAREASKEKQIVMTTHNPEMVRHTSLDELILVSRDDKGFSTITRPKDNEVVRGFLSHEVGLEDVYVQNLLET